MRRCRVLIGISTTSSWSLPKAPWPLETRVPMTSQLIALTRSCAPTALVLPKSSRCTVWPIRQPAPPARNSSLLNARQSASFQLPVVSQSLVLPITLLLQLRPLATSTEPVRASGATAAIPPICAAMASPSLSLKAGAPPPPPPGPMRWPGRTCSRLVPRPEIWFCTAAVAPLPTVTMVITALTPITMPRMVRKERSRLRRMERSASSSVLSHMGCLLAGDARDFRVAHGRVRGARLQRHRVGVALIALDHAVHEMHDAFRICGHVGLVRDHQHGDALFGVQVPEQFHDLLAAVRVEVAGGLVGQQHLRLGDDGARDGHALLLPAREFARRVVLPTLEAHPFQRAPGQAVPRSGGLAPGGPGARPRLPH